MASSHQEPCDGIIGVMSAIDVDISPDEDEVTYKKKDEDEVTYKKKDEDEVTYKKKDEDEVTYKKKDEDEVTYKKKDEDEVTIKEERWVIYNQKGQPFDKFNKWMSQHFPSKDDGIRWICVRRKRKNKYFNFPTQDRIDNMVAEWKNITESPPRNGIDYFPEVKALAEKYKVTQGKWILFVREAEVHEIWKVIAEGVINGKLTHSHAAKITGFNRINKYSIFVYTDNFLNESAVFNCVADIRRIGVKHDLLYKPDILTILGIYKRVENKFGLRPTVYRDPEFN